MRFLPNILSVSRIIVSPFTVLFLLGVFGSSFTLFSMAISSYSVALILCLYAGASDFLDGFIARRFDAKSEFGARLDEQADKYWSYPVLATLVYLGPVPLWFFLVVIIRDFFVLWSRRELRRCGEKPAVSKLGKWKMTFMFVYIAASVLLLEHHIYSEAVQLIFSVIVAGLVLLSGVHYLGQYLMRCKKLHFSL